MFTCSICSLEIHDGVDEVLEGVGLLGAGHVHLHGTVLVEPQTGHCAVNQVTDLLPQPRRVTPRARTELADVTRSWGQIQTAYTTSTDRTGRCYTLLGTDTDGLHHEHGQNWQMLHAPGDRYRRVTPRARTELADVTRSWGQIQTGYTTSTDRTGRCYTLLGTDTDGLLHEHGQNWQMLHAPGDRYRRLTPRARTELADVTRSWGQIQTAFTTSTDRTGRCYTLLGTDTDGLHHEHGQNWQT